MMLETRFELNPEMIFRLNAGSEEMSGKAFDSDNDVLHEFNPQAVAILNLVDGSRTVNDIVSALSSEYNCPAEEMKEDVILFINQALEQNLIQKKD